jgi:DNA-binding response OmpR family regulator
MHTILDDQESKLKAFDYGAVDYIVKSANEAEVGARFSVYYRSLHEAGGFLYRRPRRDGGQWKARGGSAGTCGTCPSATCPPPSRAMGAEEAEDDVAVMAVEV